MKLNKARAPQDGDHPIMYDLIRNWLARGKRVIVDSADYIMVAKSLVVDLQDKEAPVHGQRRTYKLSYQYYIRHKTPVLSTDIATTWMYPAELEDAKVVQNDNETIKIWTPDYLNDPHLMKGRK